MSVVSTKGEGLFSYPVFRLAFRPMFLLGAFFSIFALILWGAIHSGLIEASVYGGGHYWHGHEMIFGFVIAVLVGFLLTAAQNWTGIRAPYGRQLALLVCLWILARICMVLADIVPVWLTLAADLGFTLLAAFYLFGMLYEKKQSRNYFAVIALLLLTFCNASSHLSIHTATPYNFLESFYIAVLVITMMMTIIGGRVIPMFTANATGIPPRMKKQWLENAILINIWLMISLYLLNLLVTINSYLLALPFFSCAVFVALRSAMWRPSSTVKHPLLWSLQLSYWFIPLGLFLFGLHITHGFNQSLAIHTLTVGGMGAMILSMISRVSLGHTGRTIVVNSIMSVSFAMVLAAAVTRVFFVLLWPDETALFLWISIVLWSASYLLFVFKFSPVLLQARVDGKDG